MAPRGVTVSVVVPAFNAEATLKECLESLASVDFPERRIEVIVIDDGSEDDTAKIASGFRRVRLVRNPANRGTSYAKNRGIAVAGGEVVAFLDADSTVPPNWLRVVLPYLEDDRVAAVGVGQEPICGNPEFLDHLLLLGRVQFRGQPTKDIVVRPPAHPMVVDNVFNAGGVFRKEALILVGGFDESITSGEDLDLCWRLGDMGWKVLLVGGTAIRHHVKSNLRELWRQQYWYGKGLPVMWRRHPQRMPAIPALYGLLITEAAAMVALAFTIQGLAIALLAAIAASPISLYIPDVLKSRGRGARWKCRHIVVGYVKSVANVLGAIRGFPSVFSHTQMLTCMKDRTQGSGMHDSRRGALRRD